MKTQAIWLGATVIATCLTTHPSTSTAVDRGPVQVQTVAYGRYRPYYGNRAYRPNYGYGYRDYGYRPYNYGYPSSNYGYPSSNYGYPSSNYGYRSYNNGYRSNYYSPYGYGGYGYRY